MRMPATPEGTLLAPCGMDCLVCAQHCRRENPCPGCNAADARKPKHCRDCKRKQCARQRGVALCAACPAFPCARLKSLDRAYKRYGVSLIENGRAAARDVGLFWEAEQKRWTCPACGGVISLHDRVCSDCGKGSIV